MTALVLSSRARTSAPCRYRSTCMCSEHRGRSSHFLGTAWQRSGFIAHTGEPDRLLPRAHHTPEPAMKLLTPREVADELRMSVTTLRRHAANGNIGYVETGHGTIKKHIRFRRDDVDAFLVRQRRSRELPPDDPSDDPPAPRKRGRGSRESDVRRDIVRRAIKEVTERYHRLKRDE
jgi:excisionase family DNA binding protein